MPSVMSPEQRRAVIVRAPLAYPSVQGSVAQSDWVLVPSVELVGADRIQPRDAGYSIAVPFSSDDAAYTSLTDFVSSDSNLLASAVAMSGQAYYDQLISVVEAFELRAIELGKRFLKEKKKLTQELIAEIAESRAQLATQLKGLRTVVGRRYWEALPSADFAKLWQIRNQTGSQIQPGSKTFEAFAKALPEGVSLPGKLVTVASKHAKLLSQASGWVAAVEVSAAVALVLTARNDKDRRSALVALGSKGLSKAADQAVKFAAKYVVARYGLIIAMPLVVGTAPGFIAGLAASVALGLAIEYGANAVASGASLLWDANNETLKADPLP